MHGPHYSTQKQTRAFSFLRKKQRVTEIVQKKNAFFLSWFYTNKDQNEFEKNLSITSIVLNKIN